MRYPEVRRSLPARAGRRVLRALGRPPQIDHLPALDLTAEDIVVVPEIMPRLAQIAPQARKAVFNQNAYLTFAPFPLDVEPGELVYARPDLLGAIVVSKDSRLYLQTLFPSLRVRRVHQGIDPQIFTFSPRKKRQIAYMPRKNREDLHQVLLRLRLTGRLKGWDVVEIDDRTELETGELLRESAVFLSSGHPEGFGLSAAEAMSAGCIVVGYHGYGGREFLTEDLAFPVAVGDIVAFTDRVAEILEKLETRPDALRRRAERASRFIAENYSLDREETDLLTIWGEFAGHPK